MRGIFISFEGNEGSGKTSVIKAVNSYLIDNGYKVIMTREPGGIQIAEQIRDVILKNQNTSMDRMTEALLFAASRRQHLVEKIVPALEDGYIVLCDRYVDSSLVYQGYARGIGIETVLKINQYAMENRFPDLTLFINVRPEVGLNRVFSEANREKNRLDLESLSFHKKIHEGYIKLCEMYPNRVKNINGEQPKEKVSEDVIEEIKKII